MIWILREFNFELKKIEIKDKKEVIEIFKKFQDI